MDMILVDLEWNGAPLYSTGGYFNEIIEIGAVKVNERLETIDTFQSLIRPQVHKKLTGRVKRLTHISNDEVRGAMSFLAAMEIFRRWVGDGDNCFMTWGTGDLLVWLENLERIGRPQRLETAHNYCNAQELCRIALGMEKNKQPGLSMVAEAVGVPFVDDEMHRALEDSIISMDCVRKVWDPELFEQLRSPVDDEFIRKLTFKTVSLCDIDNPLIDRKLMFADCPVCGSRMEQLTEAAARSRGFYIDYRCGGCGDVYQCKHTFRLKYEGVEHKRSIKLKPTAPPESAEENGESADEQ